jgi:hypothetical protein
MPRCARITGCARVETIRASRMKTAASNRVMVPRRPPKVYQAWPLESVPGSVATSKCTTRVGGHFKVYQLT